MKLFYTNASAKEEIGKLESQIANLDADATASAKEIETLKADLATANESLAVMTTERDEAVAAMEAAEKTAADATDSEKAANDKLATFDAEVEKAASARFAGLGGDPIPESGKDDNHGKPDISGLTGLAKATAIHKANSKK
jgi:septal ring factor EnvC (AmiA/AmiB activator)